MAYWECKKVVVVLKKTVYGSEEDGGRTQTLGNDAKVLAAAATKNCFQWKKKLQKAIIETVYGDRNFEGIFKIPQR